MREIFVAFAKMMGSGKVLENREDQHRRNKRERWAREEEERKKEET